MKILRSILISLLILSPVFFLVTFADESYSDAEMLSFQAFWLAQNGSVSSAMQLQDEAIAAEPSSPLIWYQRGRLFEDHKKDDASAAECYRKSYDLDPTNEVTKLYLKNALWRLGRYDEADAIEHMYEKKTTATELPADFDKKSYLHIISTSQGDLNVYYPDIVSAEYEQGKKKWSYRYAIENTLPDTIYLKRMKEYTEDNEGDLWTEEGGPGLFPVQIVIEPGDVYIDTFWVNSGKEDSTFCGGSSMRIYEGFLENDLEISIPVSVGLSCS